MDDLPLSVLLLALFVLLLLSAFFSMSETSMMAVNRYRLKHRADAGARGARLALALLDRTDKLLGVILLGNNLVNAAAATLVSVIVIGLFGDEKWALGVGTLFTTFAILVFSEISPKIIAATHADRIAPIVSFLLKPLLTIAYPIVWFVNLFAVGFLRVTRISTRKSGAHQLTPEEMRTLVLEAGNLLPHKHKSVLLNLLDLGQITVEDVMTPRGAIESVDLSGDWGEIVQQLMTSHHSRVVVYAADPDKVHGVLHLRRCAGQIGNPEWSLAELEAVLQPPYYVPAGTPVLTQLQYFQEQRQRMGIVVDEYGEVLGLVTPEDIVEEIVGEFTASAAQQQPLAWPEAGAVLVDGGRTLRELNRKLGVNFPVDGPKTLNGLILEHFQDIPESGVSLRIAGIPIEVVQTQGKSVKTARIFRPEPGTRSQQP